MILIGQPELAAILEQPKLRQLAQRVTARYHLEPLSRAETRAYVRHRLAVAGRGRPVVHRARPADAAPPVARHSRASSTPSPIAPSWAPTRGSVPRSMPRPCGARRPRCWASLRRGGSGGRDAPPRRPSLPPPEASGSCSSRRATSAGTRPAGRASCRAGRARRWPARPRRRTGVIAVGAAAPSPAPRLAEVLRDPAVAATKGDALAVLLGLWGVHADGRRSRTATGPPAGALECLATVGGWQKLRRLDLPAALELAGPGGERRYAVLTALTPSEATLRFGDRVVTALLAEVEPFWDGAFVVLWRPPPGELPVRRGARGPAADWLRQRMARAAGAGLPVETAGRTTRACGSWSRPSRRPARSSRTAWSGARPPWSCGGRNGDPTCRGSRPGWSSRVLHSRCPQEGGA